MITEQLGGLPDAIATHPRPWSDCQTGPGYQAAELRLLRLHMPLVTELRHGGERATLQCECSVVDQLPCEEVGDLVERVPVHFAMVTGVEMDGLRKQARGIEVFGSGEETLQQLARGCDTDAGDAQPGPPDVRMDCVGSRRVQKCVRLSARHDPFDGPGEAAALKIGRAH